MRSTFKFLRFTWWLTAAFIDKRKSTILTAIATTILLILLIVKISPRLPINRLLPQRPLTIALVGRFRVSELPRIITDKISSGLTAIDETGRAVPALANDWRVEDEGKTYIFSIDISKAWHDGTKVTAFDIRVPIEHVTTEVANSTEIRFKLVDPFAPFPTVLSIPIFKKNLIGVGEYRLKQLKRNGEFVEKLIIANGKSTLVYKFYPSSQDSLLALKLGEVDSIEDLTSISDVPKWPQIEIFPHQNPDRYLAILFNNLDANLAEKSFRQALAYAIPDKPAGEERIISPISKTSWAYNPQVKQYQWDNAKAKELLKSAFGDNPLPTLELTTFLPYLPLAEDIAKAWFSLGVNTAVKVSLVTPSNFQVLLSGQQIPPDPDQYVFWHSTQSTNLTHYSSRKVDKLLEDGRQTVNEEKRKEIYWDFQRFLLEDSPSVFLKPITTYTVSRK